MATRPATVGLIVQECHFYYELGHTFTSLLQLSERVSKMTGVSRRTVDRAFASTPALYHLSALVPGTDREMTDPHRCSDLPGDRRSDADMTEIRPEPDRPRTMPATPLGSPAPQNARPDAPAHAGPPPAPTLDSALSPSAAPATKRSYSRIGPPSKHDDDCFYCRQFVPGQEGSGDGYVFGHVLVPFTPGTAARIICLDPGCRALHSASVVIDNIHPDQGDPT